MGSYLVVPALVVCATALAAASITTTSQLETILDIRVTACESAKTRVEWRKLPDADRLAFVQAVKCLMVTPPKATNTNATSRYDELVYVHLSMADVIHQDAIFLPWHRYFVSGFESMLRSECGYNAAFPWWYELQDAGNFGASSFFTPDYFGSLPESTAPEDQPAESFCVTDGAFANRTVLLGFDTPECLSRGETKAYSALATQARLDACHVNIPDYNTHARCVGNGIHTSTHAAIGKIVGNIPAAVNDPIFFMHHSFVDWEWMRWQRDDGARWEAVSGCIVESGQNGDGCTTITLDYVLTTGGVFPDMKIRDVMSPKDGPLCYDYDA